MNGKTFSTIPLTDQFPSLEPSAHLDGLLKAARRKYTLPVLALADQVSQRWLVAQKNPYLDEIQDLSDRIGRVGAFMLNMSYEWACTSIVGVSHTGQPRLARTLDWPLDGLGSNVIVARVNSPVGPYYAVTWPGYVGVLTAMAPGRFAISINQAPLPRRTGVRAADWVLQKSSLCGSRDLPPHHLLRKVFDECEDYDEAVRILSSTPIALPVFYTIAGIQPGQGAVVERLQGSAVVRAMPTVVANHFLGHNIPGHPRGRDSAARHQAGIKLIDAEHLASIAGDFSWVREPILNPDTRLCVDCLPGAGVMLVQGWERHGPTTEILRIQH